MALKTYLSISLISGLSGLFFAGSSATAAIIQYKVEGTFDTGSLTGLDYLEIFTFDDSSKPNVLGSVPWTTEILSYSLDVENHSKHWTLEDWPMEHTFSQSVDANGFLNSRAYLATSGPAGNPPAFSQFLANDGDDNVPSSRSGGMKWYDWTIWNTRRTDSTDSDPTVTITTVPEPVPAFSLLALGTLGIVEIVKQKLKTLKFTEKENVKN